MIFRRMAAAVLLCSGLAALAPACTSVIGGLGNEDNVDVVAKMCRCNELLEFLGTSPQCVDYLTERFDGMTADERQDWLEAYDASCKGCDTVKKCFYRAPLCKTIGCTKDEECCTFKGEKGACNAGKCI
ncbi:Hypothetical protein A7982_03515 [Minicystis rosea]|nr:Hypothetical protein A7982_03515 [Minicystis rosea]